MAGNRYEYTIEPIDEKMIPYFKVVPVILQTDGMTPTWELDYSSFTYFWRKDGDNKYTLVIYVNALTSDPNDYSQTIPNLIDIDLYFFNERILHGLQVRKK